ncbi:MAG: ABC transporter ATP-binding protein [Thermodesulfobacteriota bacterium]
MNIAVQDVSFAYNGTDVVSEITFSCASGELVALLGPNGAGKTSLLQCLNAIHKPHRGAVFLETTPIATLSPAVVAQKVGYVAQHTETTPLTVFDAVLMGRKPHIRWRVSHRDTCIVDAALKRLELAHLSLRSLDQLSGGELQKVALARALVQEPDLLLLDEPISALDLKNQIEMLRLVRRVVDEHHIAAIMSLHDINAALRHADRIVFMKQGQCVALRAPQDINAALLEQVYEIPVEIHTLNGWPTVVPAAG